MTTAIELVTDSLYLSGVSSLEFDVPDDTQITVGLRLLNGILSQTSVDASRIPYSRSYDFNAAIGEQRYPIDGLIRVETLTFFLPGNVRFDMKQDGTYRFWGTCRVEDIQSLPYHYYVQRRVGGCDILLYFLPDQAYPMQAFGKFALTKVAINDDLDTNYDGFYQEWLKYKLSDRLGQQYNIQLSENVRRDLQQLTTEINEVTGYDLTLRKIPLTSRKDAQANWAFINYGRGWTP